MLQLQSGPTKVAGDFGRLAFPTLWTIQVVVDRLGLFGPVWTTLAKNLVLQHCPQNSVNIFLGHPVDPLCRRGLKKLPFCRLFVGALVVRCVQTHEKLFVDTLVMVGCMQTHERGSISRLHLCKTNRYSTIKSIGKY